jgi:phage/plasmid-like protein (TIGR03299 family)
VAHNLNENGNRMFYVGEKPWHGLGKELQSPATAAEAVTAAQLNYGVELQPVFAQNGREIPGRRASVRSDTQVPLGVVSDRYKVVQNIEAFSFFDTVVGEGQAIYHTAGALGLGERIWILAKLPKDVVIAREDVVEKYLVLTNTHDGTSALRLYFTPVRVVCQNTLNMSLYESREGISIRHTGEIKNKIEEARRVLGLTVNYYAQFEKIAKQLVDVKLNVETAEKYFNVVVFGKEPDKEVLESKVYQNRQKDLVRLFEEGKGNNIPEVKYSAWAAYNAVTEWVDHFKTVRGLAKDPTSRLKDVWFGTGAAYKEKAFNELAELVGVKL